MLQGVSFTLFSENRSFFVSKAYMRRNINDATMLRETMKETHCKCFVQNVTRRCQWLQSGQVYILPGVCDR